jgi:hypothetical protein
MLQSRRGGFCGRDAQAVDTGHRRCADANMRQSTLAKFSRIANNHRLCAWRNVTDAHLYKVT